MSVYANVLQGKYTALAAAARTASPAAIIGKDLIDPLNSAGQRSGINPEVSGIVAYLNVTAAPGAETLTLILEEIDPISGAVATLASTLANNATGLIRLKLKQAIAAVAASTAQVQVQDTLPPEWRLRVAHSAGGSWTYSLAVELYN